MNDIILRMTSSRRFALAGVGLLVCLGLMPIGRQAIAQQGIRSVDLRSEVAPILQEQLEASKYRTITMPDRPGMDVSLPLMVTVQSIGPVSRSNPRALVQVLIQNRGKSLLNVPVSLEKNVLHNDGNEDRRIFSCSISLTPPANPDMFLGGMVSFSASNAPSSRVQLRPGESLQLTFEANVGRLWEGDVPKWHDDIASGTILATVVCAQEILTLHPDSTREQRYYLSAVSEGVRSSNAVRLSLLP